MDQDRNEINWQ